MIPAAASPGLGGGCCTLLRRAERRRDRSRPDKASRSPLWQSPVRNARDRDEACRFRHHDLRLRLRLRPAAGGCLHSANAYQSGRMLAVLIAVLAIGSAIIFEHRAGLGRVCDPLQARLGAPALADRGTARRSGLRVRELRGWFPGFPRAPASQDKIQHRTRDSRSGRSSGHQVDAACAEGSKPRAPSAGRPARFVEHRKSRGNRPEFVRRPGP